ncbi:hypothetical protein, conserved [Leishmania tarentolae]|uniref:tRNA/rRNA methyltransferase SpoU type domain-containing protein n=1 Tax=Leishmania tarentolae TaxID=5689 RepID=A0A640KD72_LEITA|nr:hypothetical protein, conserved [Leishmania tarentolae]
MQVARAAATTPTTTTFMLCVDMTRKRKEWGTKTAWSMSFFDMIPRVAGGNVATEAPLTAAAPASSFAPPHSTTSPPCDTVTKAVGASPTSSTPPSNGKPYKERKRQEVDPLTCWRCRRCGEVLQPPLDAATGKPRYGVMMTEHLEGISSGGTTHLATGVVACAAGTMRYEKASHEENTLSHSQPRKRPCNDAGESFTEGRGTETKLVAAGTQEPQCSEQDDCAKITARESLRRLLRKCQNAARQHSSVNVAPSPLLFIVVEDPKTPANAGGILRAMRCYGLHGPATPATTVAASTEEVTDVCESVSTSTRSTADVVSGSSEGSLRHHIGSFIFSGIRLQKAMAHSKFAHALPTDPTHAALDIPQLCVPTLDVLFDVLRNEYGYQQKEPQSSSPPSVRVVAVELVEGAIPLPFYEHPFSHATEPVALSRVETGAASAVAQSPMVFYVFGAEDSTLSAHHVQHDVEDVVFIPTTGSMNLAATVNVLLYDRLSKECCGGVHFETEEAVAARGRWKGVFDARNANNRMRWARSPH